MKRPHFFLILFLLSIFSLSAQNNKFRIPDSSVIRKTVAENWFEEPLSALRNNRTELRTNSIGQVFQVKMEETRDIFSIIVSPETKVAVDLYTQDGVQHKMVDEYPVDAPGSWILNRDSVTGKALNIRFYFARDSEVFVQFSPAGKKTLADFVIDGCFVSRGVPVGVDFDFFYTASFAQVLDLTEKSLPWRYADIHPEQYHGNLVMIGVIRKNLERIKYEKNATYDAYDKPVYVSDGKERKVEKSDVQNDILTMDDLGFLKWIVDGLVKPLVGSSLHTDPLRRATTVQNPIGTQGIRGAKESLFRSLDWTRNLASAKLSIQARKNYLYEQSGVDVKIEPFSSEISEKGIAQVAGYIKDSGYEIKYLKPLLYVLASSEPTYFYLAAIRRTVHPADGSPEFKIFDSSAAIIPYFDKDGQFGCTVFENGKEMSLAQFTKKYPDSFVHMTRVLSSDLFAPL
ncbi:MAG: hypothetical protein IJ630_06360 [Treponema sp.]|nr:hypothetical protein [Treponema sp.]